MSGDQGDESYVVEDQRQIRQSSERQRHRRGEGQAEEDARVHGLCPARRQVSPAGTCRPVFLWASLGGPPRRTFGFQEL